MTLAAVPRGPFPRLLVFGNFGLLSSSQRDYMITEESLYGMTPRRMVMTGKPIRDMELENPQIVSRGAPVTLVYKDGAMTLSARGKSMQGGARGDLVRVINMNSNRSLEGIVTAENEITVTAQN